MPTVASGGVGWSIPHGPRRTWIATRPAAAAGSTSLSTRSPTYATSDGVAPRELDDELEEARIRLLDAQARG